MCLRWCCNVVFVLLVVLATAVAGAAPNGSRLMRVRKKLIDENAGYPRLEVLRDHIREYEAKAPFDGKTLYIAGGAPMYNLFTGRPWSADVFAAEVELLKSIEFRQFTDNFLAMSARPGGVDWFDDATWEVIAGKFRIMARTARNGGCVGLLFDPEHYAHEGMKPQFAFDAADGRTFPETWDMVRQRGQMVGKAMAEEFPELKFFCFFAFSYALTYSQANDLYRAMAAHPQGLLVSFINGIIETMTPGMRLIDGHETEGYRAADEQAYLITYARHAQMAVEYLLPENRFRAGQYQLAHAVYLDAYFRDESFDVKNWNWDIAPNVPQNDVKTRLRLFDRNLAAARRWSDEYVWVYGNRGHWVGPDLETWKWGNAVVKYWDDIAPGVSDIVRSQQDPEAYVARANLPNLVKNHDFLGTGSDGEARPVSDHIPSQLTSWNLWRPERSQHAVLQVQPGRGQGGSSALAVTGFAGGGCLSQNIVVEPGDRFLFRVSVMGPPGHQAKLMVFYRKTPDRWHWGEDAIPPIAWPEPGDGKTWQTVAIPVEVPDGIVAIAIGLNFGIQTYAEPLLFSRPEVFHLNRF